MLAEELFLRLLYNFEYTFCHVSIMFVVSRSKMYSFFEGDGTLVGSVRGGFVLTRECMNTPLNSWTGKFFHFCYSHRFLVLL
jgi:hypothetical protein